MANQTDQVPNLKSWIKKQIQIGNTIRVIVNTLILPMLIFWLVGESLNNLIFTFQGFFLMFFTIIPLIILHDTITESRAAFLDGKWKLKSIENSSHAKIQTYLWRRLVPTIIPIAFIIALAYFFSFGAYSWISGNTSLPLPSPEFPSAALLLTMGLCFLPLLLFGIYWIKHNLSTELSAFTNTVSNPPSSPQTSFLRYFLFDHAIPWIIILGILNFGINFKGFSENLLIDGVITIGDLVYSVWITAFVLIIWMGLSALTQMRGDLSIGRFQCNRTFPLWGWILSIILIPFVMGFFAYLPLFFGITAIDVIPATIVVVLDAILIGSLGRLLGILIGIRLERKKNPKPSE
ncbi:MAG: hypothetical protein ACTSRL_06205 [Candidatus Helarchaeota archaeon]